jgi:streptomycin 3"-adenylyltransferase
VGALPGQLSAYASRLVVNLQAAAGASLTGVYLHGSGALGDWDPRRSDVDVLVVAQTGDVTAYADVLTAVRTHCPGTGIEASVVRADAARNPSAPWPYLVHVTDREVVLGEAGDGDEDLILHYAVCREHGAAAFGPDPSAVFGCIARDIIVEQLARELRWALDHAGESYAVLNACRALRFAREGVLCSKSEGGAWAVRNGIGERVVPSALQARQDAARSTPPGPAATAWIARVASALDTEHPRA